MMKQNSKKSGTKTALTILMLVIAAGVILTAGCTGTTSQPITQTPTPAATPEVQPTATEAAQVTAGATQTPATNGPIYAAGMIVTNGKGTLKVIGEYNPKTERYCTRTIMQDRDGNAYLLKDGSFKELGSDYDAYKSFEQLYNTVYDDLSAHTDAAEEVYNVNEKSGQRIPVYATNDRINLVGYLIPSDALTMDYLNAKTE